MILGFPKEVVKNEQRFALNPKIAKQYVEKGFVLLIESGAAEECNIDDSEFIESGAQIVSSSNQIFERADVVIRFHPLQKHEFELIKNKSTYISLCQPTREIDMIKLFLEKKVTGFSMHLIPRSTLAQTMDALSSQANIAGYKAVLVGSCHLNKYMPLLMTAAGTIKPARVLIIGAGVAGLQAIATAKRLGARVEAFDVRSEVKEQVESLGATFIEVSLDSNQNSNSGGYAKEVSEDYKKKQNELICKKLKKIDLLITTALIPGKDAPKLISKDMVSIMKRGAVIMDLAAENGGNCELTTRDEIVKHNDVIIDGNTNLVSSVTTDASSLYAKNIFSFLIHIVDKENNQFNFNDEIASQALYTNDGVCMFEPLKSML